MLFLAALIFFSLAVVSLWVVLSGDDGSVDDDFWDEYP